MYSAETLLQRWSAMKSERALVNGFYQAASWMFDPINAMYLSDGHTGRSGPNWHGDLYNGAAMASATRLVDFLHGNATPSTSKWLELRDGNPEVQAIPEAATFWAASTSIVSDDMRGRGGLLKNFYTEMRKCYRWMTVSYGVLYIGEFRPDGVPTGQVFYENVPSYAFWYQLGLDGSMEACAYVRDMTNGQAEQVFGKKIIDGTSTKFSEAGRSSERKRVLQIVIRNRKGRSDAKRQDDMPWLEYWVDISEQKILARAQYRSQPFHVFGWTPVPGTPYYVGPAYDALPDAKGAAAARRAQLQTLDWAARPPLVGGSRDNLHDPERTLRPGRVTWGAMSPDGKPLIQAVGNGASPAVFGYQVQEDEARLRSLMGNDQLIHTNRPEMTATEAQLIAQERALMSAPFLVSIVPAIKGAVARHFERLLEFGRLPEVPAIVEQQGEFDADVVGPLAIAARQTEVASVRSLVDDLGYLAQFSPLAAQSANEKALIEKVYAAHGAQALMGNLEQIMRGMAEQAEQQSRAMEAQIGREEAEAARKGVQAVTTAMEAGA